MVFDTELKMDLNMVGVQGCQTPNRWSGKRVRETEMVMFRSLYSLQYSSLNTGDFTRESQWQAVKVVKQME